MLDLKEKELVEDPATEILTKYLKWTELPAKNAETMRGSKKEVILYPILRESIRRLNPWINDENLEQVVRALTRVIATSEIETNEKCYDMIQRGITVRQDTHDGLGLKGRDVKIIDYDNPDNNQYHFVRQFRIEYRVEHLKEKENTPDLVLFVNGIPIIVIECKSPTLQKPLDEGRKQVFRYQECHDKYRGLGCPQLFHTVQMIAVLTADQAIFGTNHTPSRFWTEWHDPYPRTLDDVHVTLGKKPNAQETFLFGTCSRENLLDIIQNFIVFERESGRIVKKLAMYMQYRAVNRVIARVTSRDRYGGIIWHWQGSGKSLTMLWVAVKLRRMKELNNPTIVVVTDRVDLDNQIFATFEHCGFQRPIQAKNGRHLKELLSNPVGQTIMTTVQKFQDAAEIYPVLTENSNVYVLTDEAHETQYGWFAANMRNAIINGCFLAFTGTPIAKKNRNTFEKFGPYIDRYDHIQSNTDRVTVPIKYTGLLPEMYVTGGTLEEVFNRIFANKTPAEREELKKKYATIEAIAVAPQRIEEIAHNIISHFESTIQPNGFKGQVVAVSREAAILYYNKIRELHGPSCEVLISSVHNEEQPYASFHKEKTEEEEIIRRFKEEQDPQLLIVCDKLIKGFNAPVEQVMYLDKPLREHTLLQAIGRVDRKMKNKEYGLIVDYWGLVTELNEALIMYGTDVSTGMVETDYIPRLIAHTEEARTAAMNFFQPVPKIGNKAIDDEACVEYLEPEDRRIQFNQLFKAFATYTDMLLPDPAALPFRKDFVWLGEIKLRARNRFRDNNLDISDCSGKVKKLIAEHLTVSGIMVLNEPISIFSPQFNEFVESLPTRRARASEIAHAINHEITIKTREDPVFYESLKDRLDRIIREARQKRIDEQKTLDDLAHLLGEVKNPRAHADQLGIDPEIAPIYALLAKQTGEIEGLKETSEEIYEALKEHAVIGWESKIDAQREMRKSIKEVLRSKKTPVKDTDTFVAQIIDLAKGRAPS